MFTIVRAGFFRGPWRTIRGRWGGQRLRIARRRVLPRDLGTGLEDCVVSPNRC